jgi:hypothetical protein
METYFKNDYQISDIDRPIIKRMEQEIINKGLVTSSKMAVGFMMARTYPNFNDNYHAVTKETLLNALKVNALPKVNINHFEETMIGYIGYMDLVNDRLYGVGILDRPMLDVYNLKPEDLPLYGTSIETRFKDYDYFCNGRILLRKEHPEFEDKVQDLLDGKNVIGPQGKRLGLLWGGVNGLLEINSHSILMNGIAAEKDSSVLLAVAEKQFDIKKFILELEAEKNKKNDVVIF